MRTAFLTMMLIITGACSSGSNLGEEQQAVYCMDCEDTCKTTKGHDGVLICHVPPGNEENPRTLCVDDDATRAGHGYHEADYCGMCEPVCGDQTCDELAGENCETCSADCGECPPVCGDQTCDPGEDCESCAEDCGECCDICGNESCDESESCVTCPFDCGQCPPECGDQSCNGEETCGSCPSDCGACPPECGDESCNGEETCATCAQDCGVCPPSCGDESCDGEETCRSCPTDCGECGPECGDQLCNGEETCGSCPQDCGECGPTCGDESCDKGENCGNCPADCGTCVTCGNQQCDENETCATCPLDCGECPMPPDGGPVEEPDAGQPDPDGGPVQPRARFTVEGGGCSTGGGSASLLAALMIGAFLMTRKRAWLLGLVFPFIFAGNAMAQDIPETGTDITTERLTIPMDKFGLLNVESAATRRQGAWGLNLALGYSNDSMVVREVGSDRVGSLVGDRVGASLGAFYSLGALEVGLALPMVLYQGRDTDSVETGNSIDTAGLGNLQGQFKVALRNGPKLKIAGMFALDLPTASGDYMGENDLVSHFSVLAEGRHRNFRLLTEVGVRLEENQDSVGDLWVDEEMLAKVALGYRTGSVEPGVSFSYATTLGDEAFEVRRRNYGEVMVGGNWYANQNWTVFAGAGRGVNEGYGSPDFRMFAGLRYEPAAKKPAVKPPVAPEPPVVDPPPPVEPPVVETPAPPMAIVVDDTFFKFDRSELTPAGQAMLQKVAADILSLKDYGSVTLKVVGHTDSIGSRRYNEGLGLRRARAVEAALVVHGVDALHVVTSSAGEMTPRASNKTVEGRAQNRRVEITVEGYEPVEHQHGSPDGSTDDPYGDIPGL